MKNATREKLELFFANQAKNNDVPLTVVAGGKSFAVAPTIEQNLENKIQESSGFLGLINTVGVDEMEGEKLGLGVGSTIASRTDTSVNDRQTQYVGTLDDNRYKVTKTDFDTHITYGLLDSWAKFKDFELRLANQIVHRIGLDRIMIGWNGTSAAVATDRAINPLLQDVNVGWLQQYRSNSAARVMTEGGTPGEISVGAGGDYATLDALAYDIKNNALEPWYRRNTDLVVIIGSSLYTDVNFVKVNQIYKPSEEKALASLLQNGIIGGMPVVEVPYFPDNTMMITSLSNLSLYYQNGKHRRTFVDNAKRDRLETYASSNDGYVVEDYGLGGVAENIKLV